MNKIPYQVVVGWWYVPTLLILPSTPQSREKLLIPGTLQAVVVRAPDAQAIDTRGLCLLDLTRSRLSWSV